VADLVGRVAHIVPADAAVIAPRDRERVSEVESAEFAGGDFRDYEVPRSIAR
jgi:hypothetical protein